MSLLARATVILLDFDGPVCGVFAGRPAPGVAARLADIVASIGHVAPGELVRGGDPIELLRWADTFQDPNLTRTVEDALIAEERAAVAVAEPTCGADILITTARHVGKRVAVVSNNSGAAVADYLAVHGLARDVDVVVGRAYAEPARMKPDPSPLHTALAALGAVPEDAVMVGDSIADVAAARAAGVPVIGYANRDGKDTRLAGAGADIIVTDMAALATDLRRVA